MGQTQLAKSSCEKDLRILVDHLAQDKPTEWPGNLKSEKEQKAYGIRNVILTVRGNRGSHSLINLATDWATQKFHFQFQQTLKAAAVGVTTCLQFHQWKPRAFSVGRGRQEASANLSRKRH